LGKELSISLAQKSRKMGKTSPKSEIFICSDLDFLNMHRDFYDILQL
jgi:hypothetical protein